MLELLICLLRDLLWEDISKKIDRFKGDAENDIIDLAKELLDFGKKNIEFLKPYL